MDFGSGCGIRRFSSIVCIRHKPGEAAFADLSAGGFYSLAKEGIMTIRYVRALAVALLASAAPVHANPVAEWNSIATQIAASEERPSVPAAHAVTMVHVAMFEVLNFIEHRYASQYFVHPAAPLNLSRPAAVAAAAHFMLVEFYPHKKAELDEMLRGSLAAIPAGTEARSAGIQGRALAMNLYALRSLVLDEDAPAPDSALSWNRIVAELAAARGLSLIETARLHALVSTTVVRAYATDDRHACTPCVADTAVRTILDAEFGSAQAGREIGNAALAQWTALEVVR
jgi:hypothetical protein